MNENEKILKREAIKQEARRVATAILKLLVESNVPQDYYCPVLLGVQSNIDWQKREFARQVTVVAQDVLLEACFP